MSRLKKAWLSGFKGNLNRGNQYGCGGGPAPRCPPPTPPRSDAAGNFVFDDVEPGRYTLSAERAGYVRGAHGPRPNAATPLVLAAGQKLTGISIKLAPEGVISGKITDEDGDPVARAQVMLYQSRYLNGRRTMTLAGSAVNTAADGTYQITGLVGGRYYLSAQDLQGFVLNGPSEAPGSKGPEMTYVATFYPNGTDPTSAVGIDVASGNEVRGIEVRLQKVRIFRVRGRIDATQVANTALSLVPQDSPDAMLITQARPTSQIRPDGTFDFERVPAGTYMIRSQGFRSNSEQGQGTQLYSRQLVTVSTSNVDNVEVRLIPGSDIAGKITVEGQTSASGAPSPTARPAVQIFPLQPGFSGNVGAQSNPDGTFIMKNVPPDIYRVALNGLPAGTYVKTIRFGGADVTKAAFDTSTGSSGEIDILLSPEAADLSGVARNSKGDAVAGVTVTLWEPGTPNTLPDALVNRSATTDQEWTFSVS